MQTNADRHALLTSRGSTVNRMPFSWIRMQIDMRMIMVQNTLRISALEQGDTRFFADVCKFLMCLRQSMHRLQIRTTVLSIKCRLTGLECR